MSDNYTNGKILISTPKISNRMFKKTIVYVHSEDDTGAIGVMLNRPMEKDMADRFSLDIGWQYPEKIFLGGPDDRQLGYILHSNDYANESTIGLNDYIAYTGAKNIVYDINRGIGPSQFALVTGYCSWQSGQLQEEINDGMWLVTDFDNDYFFQPLGHEEGWNHSVNIAAHNKVRELLESIDTN